VQALGNTRTAAMGNLVPLLTIVVAWPMLGEVPNVWQVTGALVVIAGVSIVRHAAAGGATDSPVGDAERPRP
jgi:drug/metabolite transporter (DMT)-like permease